MILLFPSRDRVRGGKQRAGKKRMREKGRWLTKIQFFAPFEDALRVNEVLLGDGA